MPLNARLLVSALSAVILALYVEYLQLPELISVTIESSRASLLFQAAPLNPQVTTIPAHVTSTWQDVEYAMTTDSELELARFDDEAFMKQYTCNRRHGYTVRVLSRDPQIIYIAGFLAPGEADHMRMAAMPKMNRSRVVGDEHYVHEARTR